MYYRNFAPSIPCFRAHSRLWTSGIISTHLRAHGKGHAKCGPRGSLVLIITRVKVLDQHQVKQYRPITVPFRGSLECPLSDVILSVSAENDRFNRMHAMWEIGGHCHWNAFRWQHASPQCLQRRSPKFGQRLSCHRTRALHSAHSCDVQDNQSSVSSEFRQMY